MKRVYLTVGPRWAGKSTFCNQVLSAYPQVVLISRDAILLELFGSVELDAYTGQHYTGKTRMWEVVRHYLCRDHIDMILDCWNSCPEERWDITTRLRLFGADYIEAWYFVTPLEKCLAWWLDDMRVLHKADIDRARQLDPDYYSAPYHSFHSLPVTLDQGFDVVRHIDSSRQYQKHNLNHISQVE